MKVNGKVVVVTGAGSGIGRGLVMCLLARGARVTAVDISPDALEQTAALASGYQDRLALFVANVGDRLKVESLPEQVMAQFGVVDAVINNAGIIPAVLPLERSRLPDAGASVERQSFWNAVLHQSVSTAIARPTGGAYCQRSSMGGFVPVPGQTIYGAAKAAVKLLSEGVASELLHTRVRVTVVFPGAVATNIMNSGLMLPGAGNATDGRHTTNPKDRKGWKALQPLSADRAAITIVQGMERNRLRVFVGRDAAVMDKLYRLSPSFAGRTIARAMGGLLPAQGRKGSGSSML